MCIAGGGRGEGGMLNPYITYIELFNATMRYSTLVTVYDRTAYILRVLHKPM